jgi:hypothetical protein
MQGTDTLRTLRQRVYRRLAAVEPACLLWGAAKWIFNKTPESDSVTRFFASVVSVTLLLKVP